MEVNTNNINNTNNNKYIVIEKDWVRKEKVGTILRPLVSGVTATVLALILIYLVYRGEEELRTFLTLTFIGVFPVTYVLVLGRQKFPRNDVSYDSFGLEEGKAFLMYGESRNLNDIFRNGKGEVYRVYQLIGTERLVKGQGILKKEVMEYNYVIPIDEVYGGVFIDENVKRGGLSYKLRAVYDVGESIPKLSEEEIKNVLNGIESINQHTTQERMIEEYNEEYSLLTTPNGELKPTYKELPEGVNLEVVRLQEELDKLETENKELTGRLYKSKDGGISAG